jgi:cation-transporting ATPase 13A2
MASEGAANYGRRSSSSYRPNGHGRSSISSNRPGQFYRRDSNMSTSSFMDEVEMAQDEVFAGPMGESVPTSVTSFAHRRGRADSTASFTYYQEDDDEPIQASDESAIVDDEEYDFQDQFEEEDSVDLEAGEHAPLRRVSTDQSREPSVHDRLLRSDSAKTDVSISGKNRTSQKIYVVTEDLTIVVAGFQTSALGYALYITLCVFTFGLAYLLLRWFPKWQIQLTGTPCPLRKCSWVVVEVGFRHWYGSLCNRMLIWSRINGANWSYKM